MANPPSHHGTPTETDLNFFYDVFLSFRGEDGTRYGFTNDLYKALRQKGIYTFRDNEEVKIGEELKSALPKAIKNSRMLIAVLCQNYATSTWCLDELANIVDCYDEGKQVLVIFYKVEPSDVWDLKNSYQKAMTEHEERFGKDSEKVKAWRNALSRVRHLSAEHYEDNQSEPELIKKIVKDTSAKLPPIPLPIKYTVGLNSRFQEVKPLIDIKSHDAVRMLEIYGVGGIGKTTFALDMFNKIRHEFEASSFLANIREKSNKSKGLQDLQKALLSEMGEAIETPMGASFQGDSEIKHRLKDKRVLLVLDDVDAVEQLKSLAGGGDWFGPGSRIIVTTREETMLDEHVMRDVIIEKYKMEELNENESLELFCWHAFGKSEPEENFEEVSSHAVSYAKGIPLALKVIGSNLKGGSRDDWEMELNKYKTIPNAEIQGVLEVSYNSLKKLDRKTFLDIACFFKGERWEYVERILNACDFAPTIRVFLVKSLITIDDNGCLDMHDLIQDMGREVVQKESPFNLGHRRRLWSYKEVLRVLKENMGSVRIEGIMLDPPSHEELKSLKNTVFKEMTNLRILIIRNTIISTAPSYLPNSLRVLDWKGYPSKSFPPNFYPQRIVDFKLPHSSLTLEKSFQVYEDLTFINVSHCQSITQIPDLSAATNLKVLTVDRCHKVVRFDKSIGFMPNLVCLSASECSMLKSFVPCMYLPSLEMLSFNLCRKLKQFPSVVQVMDKPLKIIMINTAIKEFPESIGNLIGLEYMDLSICTRLNDLSSSFLLLPKLVTLRIDGCSQLGESFKRFKTRCLTTKASSNLVTMYFSDANLSDKDLDIILGIFPKLEYLNVSHNNFGHLPEGIKESSHLKTLDVSYCRNLKEIPELPASIQKVDARYCRSLTSKASNALWSKVSEEKERVELVLPRTKIPNWFDIECESNEDIPLFWACRKFPVIALALVFGETRETAVIKVDPTISEFLPGIMSDRSHVVGLHVFIDGQEICRKDYHYFSVGEHHVLSCDLRTLFNDEEWQSLDASLGDDWKPVQIQLESWLSLNRWGVYVHKKKTNVQDMIQFHPPNPVKPASPSDLAPKRTPQMSKQRIRYAMENMNPREILGKYLSIFEENPTFTKVLLRTWRNATADTRGKASPSDYGASIKQEHEESVWDVVRVVELMKNNVPKHIAESINTDDMESAQRMIEQVLRARAEFMREKGHDRLDIDMPVILEACHSTGEAISRRYWGRIQIKHEEPAFNAVLTKTSQLAWRFSNRNNKKTLQSKDKMNIFLLKCRRRPPSTEIATTSSTSGYGDSSDSEDEFYEYDLVLEDLLSKIEEDAMRLNERFGKMKASIVLTEYLVSDNYLLETLFLRGQENTAPGGIFLELGRAELMLAGLFGTGMTGSYKFEEMPYGKLRVEQHGGRSQSQPESWANQQHGGHSQSQPESRANQQHGGHTQSQPESRANQQHGGHSQSQPESRANQQHGGHSQSQPESRANQHSNQNDSFMWSILCCCAPK